jgi:hypothetical protein
MIFSLPQALCIYQPAVKNNINAFKHGFPDPGRYYYNNENFVFSAGLRRLRSGSAMDWARVGYGGRRGLRRESGMERRRLRREPGIGSAKEPARSAVGSGVGSARAPARARAWALAQRRRFCRQVRRIRFLFSSLADDSRSAELLGESARVFPVVEVIRHPFRFLATPAAQTPLSFSSFPL